MRAQGYGIAAFDDPSHVNAEALRAADIDVLVINAPVADRQVAFDDITDAAFESALCDHLYDVVAIAQRMVGVGVDNSFENLRVYASVIVAGEAAEWGHGIN